MNVAQLQSGRLVISRASSISLVLVVLINNGDVEMSEAAEAFFNECAELELITRDEWNNKEEL